MRLIKPPQPITIKPGEKILFLAGSIEMGAAEDWQQKVETMLNDSDWVILNPRRDDWDSSWIQSKNNPQFRQQVEWELAGLEQADRVIFYFEPATKSPISLLELGLFGRTADKTIVVCPDGFWRKGNIDLVCERYGIRQASSLEEAVQMI